MTIFLHAGTHKTGSKSFQKLIAENRDALQRAGYDVFVGSHRNPTNHTELHLAAQRFERDSLAKHNFPDMVIDESYVDKIRSNVQTFLRQSTAPHQIFSNEDLAFLRHQDEFFTLRELFCRPSEEFHVVLVFRERLAFLNSYRNQILKKPGRVPLSEKSSALYVEPDTWLLDYEALKAGFRNCFGGRLTTLDYDASVREEGSVLPAIVRAMGIDPAIFGAMNYRVNVTAGSISR